MASPGINMSSLDHSLAPYNPAPASTEPTPYPHAFGAFRSTRQTPETNYHPEYRTPNNSTYYLTFQSHYIQHLRPSPSYETFNPSYLILHKIVTDSDDQMHDIVILRENVAESAEVAIIDYLAYSPSTLITYPKTGLTHRLICDPTRFDDDSTGNIVHMRDYLVYVGHEECVWQPLGPARASKDGTIMGLMELRNVMDGKLFAVLGSEQCGEGDELSTRRRLMVRGDVAPGTDTFETIVASLVAMMGRECERIGLLQLGCGPIFP